MHTAWHLHVARIQDITRLIAICNDTYKFLLHTHIVFCKNLQLTIRWWLRVTLRSWGSCTLVVKISIRLWRGLLSLLTSWIACGILVSSPSSAGMMRLALLSVLWSSCYLPQPIRHGDQLLRHHGLYMMYPWCCHNYHLGLTETLCEDPPSTGSSFSHPEGNDENITPVVSCLFMS